GREAAGPRVLRPPAAFRGVAGLAVGGRRPSNLRDFRGFLRLMTWMLTARRFALGRAFVLAMIIAAATAPSSAAHFHGKANSSISSATGPIGAGVSYSGQFGGSGDVDYYYFVTTRDNV